MTNPDDLLEALRRAVERKPMRTEPDPNDDEQPPARTGGRPIALNDDVALARIIGGALNHNRNL